MKGDTEEIQRFKCCKSGHLSQSCRSGKDGLRCKGSHHTSICDGKNARQKDETEALDKEETLEEVQSISAAILGSKILLQTIQLDVQADSKGRSNRSVSSKILLDSCRKD